MRGRVRSNRRWLWLVLPLLGVACLAEDGRGSRDTVPVSTLSDTEIVLSDTESDPLFGVVGATLVDDIVVVANRGSGTVHYYAAEDGRLLRTVGREGEGPGEFRRISWVQSVGTTIFVYDSELSRLSEFGLDGTFRGSANIRPVEPYIATMALGVFPDRTVLVTAGTKQTASRGPGIVYRDTFALLRYGPSGDYQDSVGAWLWNENYAEPIGSIGQFSHNLPAGRKSTLVVHGWHYYVVDNTEARIVVRDTAGRVVRTLEPVTAGPVELTAADHTRMRDDLLSRYPPEVRNQFKIDDIVGRMPLPSVAAPFGWHGRRDLEMLIVAENGDVWALEFGGIGAERPVWLVVDREGVMRTRIEASEELNVLFAARDHAVVLRWDDLDVESIEVRRIQRKDS